MKDQSENANVKTEVSKEPKKKLEVKDAGLSDSKIPRGLLMKYGDNWYILKAGLEWKASKLYGVGKFSVLLEIVERSPDYVLAKATFISGETMYINYGEASKANVKNSNMHSQLLHLALTRAECRVLRMATACGYVSVDELDRTVGEKSTTVTTLTDGSEPATDTQISTLRALGATLDEKPTLTKQEAVELIKEHSTAKFKGGPKHA